MTDNVVSFPEHGRLLRKERAAFCSTCGTPLKTVATETEQATKSLGRKIVEAFWGLVMAAVVLAVVFW